MKIEHEFLRNEFKRILGASQLIQEQGIKSVVILANPAAGCFSADSQMRKFSNRLENFSPHTGINIRDLKLQLFFTARPGEMGPLVRSLPELLDLSSDQEGHLLISMGGDGTHLEVLSALIGMEPVLRNRFCVFRFPAGTGNDSADAWTQEQALQALVESVSTSSLGAIKVTRKGRVPLFSFNIASLGIDAYVVHLNNSLQKKLPGNFYKLFSNIAVLFYGIMHGYSTMKVTRSRCDGSKETEERKNSITVLGVSGFRTYGNEKWVLPDERNYCSIQKNNLIQNLRFKSKLFQARHTELETCIMDTVHNITIEYSSNILMQLDGEVHELIANDFPLEMDVIDSGIRYVTAKEISTQKPYVAISRGIQDHYTEGKS